MLFFIAWHVKTLPFGLVLAGIVSAAAGVATRRFCFIRFCGTRWGFDQLYARSVVNLMLDCSRVTWAAGDRGLFSLGELRAHI
jgi:hypothetical protein